MSYRIKKYISFIALTLIFVSGALVSKANHLVGADLFYTHISGNTYRITFIAYGDCGPASATSFATLPGSRPQICIYDSSVFVANLQLRIDTPGNPLSGREITPVCAADSNNTQCTNPAFTIPGIKKFVYTGTYTLPRRSRNWRFIFTGNMGGASAAGRAAAISNIAGGSIIGLIDSLNNTWHNNSSPSLTVVPTPFFCLNASDTYNPGAIDPESDRLYFSLVPGIDGTNYCTAATYPVTYTGTYSATAPLGVAAGTLSFNSATGQLNFFPNITQRSLVVYNIAEYRNDTFVGTSQREMTFLVLTCTTAPPTGVVTAASGATVTDSTTVTLCEGSGAFSVTLGASGPDTSLRIHVTAAGLPTGATFSTVGDSTNNPISTFSWSGTGLAVGSYSFFVTFRDNACPLNGERTVAYTINVVPVPVIDAGAGGTICAGNSMTLSATGGVSYTWSPGGSLSCTACTSPTATPATTTTYTVRGTNAGGCSATDTVTVIVNPLPAAIGGPTNVCIGATVTLTDATSGGTWSSSATGIATVGSTTGIAGGVASGSATITYTLPTSCYITRGIAIDPLPVVTGPFRVCVGNTITMGATIASGTWSSSATGVASIDASTGTLSGVAAGTAIISYISPAGCLDTAIVTVNPLPATITGPSSVCVASTITLSSASAGGTWSSGSTFIATVISATGVVGGASTGVANITYTLPTGCYTTSSVTVYPLAYAGAVGGPITVCVGSSISMTSSVTGGSWSLTNGRATISAGGAVTGVSPGLDTVIYTVTNSCGSAMAYRIITVQAPPAAGTITGLSRLCVGATITLADTAAGGTWSSAATGVATVSATGVVGGVSAGTVDISYTVTNSCGSNSAVKNITVDPLPTITLSPAAPNYCIGGSTALTAGGGTTYVWSPTAALSTSTGATVTASPTLTTTYVVTVTNTYGCRDTAWSTVVVHPLPTITVPPIMICYGYSGTLTASGASTYVWSPAGTLSASAGATVTANPTDTTVYYITGTDVFGCVNSTMVTVNVNPIPLAPIVTTPIGYCMSATAIPLTATGSSLLWYTVATGGTGSVTAPTPSTATVGTTTYYVSQTVDGCESPRAQIDVNVMQNAETDFEYIVKYGCTRDTVIFTNTSQFCYRYEWSFGDGSGIDSINANPVHYYPPAVNDTVFYTVKLFGYNSICFDDSTIISLPITPNPFPTPFLYNVTASQTIIHGNSIQLNAAGGDIYMWTPNDGSLSNPNINNPIATPSDSTTYKLYSYNDDGCLDSALVHISVDFNDSESIVSGFTPNGDGLNDVFRLRPVRGTRLVEMSVYNRWGEQVFLTNDVSKGWDGTYKNEPQDMGVYNYLIITSRPDGRNKIYKGSVTLLR